MAVGLFGCATVTLCPLGCANSSEYMPVRQAPSSNGRSLSAITEARLQECAETYADQLPSGRYRVYPRVSLDANGRIIDVKTDDFPVDASDFSACARVALREMSVPDGVFISIGSTNGQTPAARGMMGTVTAPGAEIALEELAAAAGAGGPTVVFVVVIVLAASGVKDIVEVIDELQENKRRCNEKRTQCLDTYRSGRPGSVWGASLCDMCRDKCIGLGGEWPSHVFLDGRFRSCK